MKSPYDLLWKDLKYKESGTFLTTYVQSFFFLVRNISMYHAENEQLLSTQTLKETVNDS